MTIKQAYFVLLTQDAQKRNKKPLNIYSPAVFLNDWAGALKRLSFDSSFFVLAFELFDTPCSINDFMLAGEEWVRRTCRLDDD